VKAVITGPRQGWLNEESKLPYLKVETEFDELPQKGEHITLNSGSVYVVESRSWYVQGPENEEYWNRGDYTTDEARQQAVHLNVQPAGYKDSRIAAREEGAAYARTSLSARLAAAVKAGLDDSGQLAVVRAWLAEDARETL
jgi:hypothetical protein